MHVDWNDNTYTGAPDECSRCWPHKIHEGRCSEECSDCIRINKMLDDQIDHDLMFNEWTDGGLTNNKKEGK